MECRVCGNDLNDGVKFCPNCGSAAMTSTEAEDVLDEALEKAQEAFETELEVSGSDDGMDNQPDAPKSAREKFEKMRERMRTGMDNTVNFTRKVTDTTSDAVRKTREVSADVAGKVKKGTEDAKEFGRKVGDTSVKAYRKGQEIHADVSDKVGKAVDKTVEISSEAAEIAKKTGRAAKKAVVRTKETMEELGQVGVIITQRALDVVRASLVAVEIVDDYLTRRKSGYEVGNFITGVGIPPYLEIEFHKRSGDLTSEERRLIEEIRARTITCAELEKYLVQLDSNRIDEGNNGNAEL